jgi:hypothetical protein
MRATQRNLSQVAGPAGHEVTLRKEDLLVEHCGPVLGQRRVESDDANPPLDRVEIASMDSYPCSDPPGYYPIST